MSDSARHFRFAAALVTFAIPVVACSGKIGVYQTTGSGGGTGVEVVGPAVLNGKSPEEVLASCAAPSPGRSPLRRLSNTEYRNTISDLFANVPAVAALVPAATAGFPRSPSRSAFATAATTSPCRRWPGRSTWTPQSRSPRRPPAPAPS